MMRVVKVLGVEWDAAMRKPKRSRKPIAPESCEQGRSRLRRKTDFPSPFGRGRQILECGDSSPAFKSADKSAHSKWLAPASRAGCAKYVVAFGSGSESAT